MTCWLLEPGNRYLVVSNHSKLEQGLMEKLLKVALLVAFSTVEHAVFEGDAF